MHAVLGKQLDDGRVQLVLNLMDGSLKLIAGHALAHDNRLLGDDGAAVVVGVGKVHRDARHLHAALVGVLDGMGPLESRQQGRVQVHDTVGERLKQRLAHHAHVPRHDDVVHAMVEQRGSDDLVGRDGVGAVQVGRERHRGDVGLGGALEAVGALTARDDDLDTGIERAVSDAVDDGLQVRARTGDKDAELDSHWCAPYL